MIKLENVLEIIKIAMTNNEKCNTCIFRGKCLSSDYSYYIREGDCK